MRLVPLDTKIAVLALAVAILGVIIALVIGVIQIRQNQQARVIIPEHSTMGIEPGTYDEPLENGAALPASAMFRLRLHLMDGTDRFVQTHEMHGDEMPTLDDLFMKEVAPNIYEVDSYRLSWDGHQLIAWVGNGDAHRNAPFESGRSMGGVYSIHVNIRGYASPHQRTMIELADDHDAERIDGTYVIHLFAVWVRL